MSNENWASIVGYEGLYEISDLGQIRRIGKASGAKLGRILRQKTSHTGYSEIVLSKNDISQSHLVHRLVLEAFVGPCPPGMEACHNNGDRSDNRLENLRWDTRSSNAADRTKHGTQVRGEKVASAKLTEGDVCEIRHLHTCGVKAASSRRTIRCDPNSNILHCAIPVVEARVKRL